MIFEPLQIAGAMRVQVDRKPDERGFFGRTFCAREFEAHGLPTAAVQSSISQNNRAGTLRGMHFQWPPSREGKLVRCIRGEVWDVLLDLRPTSATFLRHQGLRLNEENRDAVYIPHGVAHGFVTLRADTEVLYQMTDYFAPDLQTGVRWNDPQFGIGWPVAVAVISERDATYPDFDRASYEVEFRRRSAAGATP